MRTYIVPPFTGTYMLQGTCLFCGVGMVIATASTCGGWQLLSESNHLHPPPVCGPTSSIVHLVIGVTTMVPDPSCVFSSWEFCDFNHTMSRGITAVNCCNVGSAVWRCSVSNVVLLCYGRRGDKPVLDR